MKSRDEKTTRREFVASMAGAFAGATLLGADALAQVRRPVPTPAQLEWQRDELAMFLHFGVNTFTDREWGDGREDPAIFNPTKLDARAWARTAKAAGFRAMILTAKHHDGFCLWPTKTTTHSVASSPWRGGRGDLVREFVDACRAEGLKPGLYLSPWDRHEPRYGDSEAYNNFYAEQLTELLTRYGRIQEVWFDGANGEGPNGKRQVYDWPRTWGIVKKLQPDAIIFSDAGPGVRWIGNERGVAGDTSWSTIDPEAVRVPGQTGRGIGQILQRGDPAGSVWRPGETDVSIRPGWFHHPAEDARVKTVDQLVSLYFTSVGRNSKLLLNVPPTKDGVLHPTDVERLMGMRTLLTQMFQTDLVANRRPTGKQTGPLSAVSEIDLGRPVSIRIADLREDIARGQIVKLYTLEGKNDGDWERITSGTTIGYRKLDRLVTPVTARWIRLTINDALEAPRPVKIALY